MSLYHSYDPGNGHGLPHDPLKAIIAPRPIGWISTVDRSGVVNLAPYSFFNMVSSQPPLVMFSSEGRKNTVRNIQATGEFCCNLATLDCAEQINATSQDFPHGVDEMARVGIEPVRNDIIAAPRIRDCATALECRAVEVKILSDLDERPVDVHMVVGQIVKVHILKEHLIEGLFDVASAKTLARAGYRGDYVVAERTIEFLPPKSA